MSQRYPPPHQRYTPRQSQYTPARFEHDRWNRDDRRASPRGFSPVRDRRDSRDQGPRDLDIDRAQRLPREIGPASAGSGISDAGRFSNAPFRGSSYTGRGRGRDWADRGRQRPFGPDDRDRDSFRPRSRSRNRTDRERSADSREFERRDDRRDDYRRDEDWHYRRARPDDREFPRREGPTRPDARPLDSKSNDDARGLSPVDRPRPPSPLRRSSPDVKKDLDPARRQSTLGDLFPHAAARRDLERGDSSSRSDAPRERPTSRQPEGDAHSSVAVPQFGSIPLSASILAPKSLSSASMQQIKPAVAKQSLSDAETSSQLSTIAHPTQSVETVPNDKAIASVPNLPTVSNDVPKFPPPPESEDLDTQSNIAADAKEEKLSATIRTIPEASTAPGSGNQPFSNAIVKSHELNIEAVQRETTYQASNAASAIAGPKQETLNSEPLRVPARNVPIGSPVLQNRLAPLTAPTGPRNTVNQQSGRAASAGPLGRSTSPTSNLSTNSQIPKANSIVANGLPINVPTGPRADRTSRQPPTAPRSQQNFQGRAAVTSLQWRANAITNQGRVAVVPAKRDADGEEKDLGLQRAASASLEAVNNSHVNQLDTRPHLRPEGSISRPKSPQLHMDQDVQMEDASGPRSPEALAFDTDDDDMALDEDDFQEQAARYNYKKADLEAQHIDLAEQWQRIAVLIEETDRLRGVLSIINDLSLPDRPAPRTQSAPISNITSDMNSNIIEALSGPYDKSELETFLSESLQGSPDLSCLPYLAERPLTPSLTSDDTEDLDVSSKQLLMNTLHVVEADQADTQRLLAFQFSELYRPWKRNVNLMQKLKDDAEAEAAALLAEQQKLNADVPEPVAEVAPAPLLTPNAERRRQFTSVLDLQRVLEESRQEEEARREKAEREAKEARASAEREATIFPLLCDDDLTLRIFKDTSLLRTAEESLRVFEYAPPVDTFTEDEDRRLRDEYDLGTKMWHKIADAVGRTTKECINHYYATKWEQPYKRQKHKKRKGKKGPSRRVETEMTQQDANIGLTETGRPRRAAAPTFSKSEKGKTEEIETDAAMSTAKKPLGQKPADLGATEEKVARGRKPAKEKQARKPRGQQVISKPGPSPQKPTKDKMVKERAHIPGVDISPAHAEPILISQQPVYHSEKMIATLLPSQPATMEPHVPLLHSKTDLAPHPIVPLPAPTTTAPVSERPRSHSQTQRGGPSSYWSVPEEGDFKECLKYFGTDFNAIANHMGKKTAVMCKNHFSKYKQDPLKYSELLAGTRDADERRKTGAPLPPLPTTLRKKHDATAMNTARVLVPPAEMAESARTPSLPMNEPLQFHPTNRVQVLHQQQIAAAPQGYPPHLTSAAQSLPHKQRLYFQDSSPNKAHVAQVSPSTDPALSLEAARHRPAGRIKTEYETQSRSTIVNARDQDNRSGMVPDMRSTIQHTGSENQMHIPRLGGPEKLSNNPNHYPVSSQPNLGPNIRPALHDTMVSHNHPSHPRPHENMPPSSTLQPQHHMQLDQLGRPLRPQSPSVRDYSTGPGYAQRTTALATAQPLVNRPPESTTGPPPAPSRKVNIMSMLNPEPTEEQRPRRAEAERPRSSTAQAGHHSMGEQYNKQHSEQYQDPASRRSHSTIYPGAHHAMVADPSHSLPPREGWSARSSFAQPGAATESPHMQHVAAHGSTSTRDFRGHVSSISHQRAIPSPTGNRYGHSRNSSFNQSQTGPLASSAVTAPSEAYPSNMRGGFTQPHSQAQAQMPRGTSSAISNSNYPGGYADQSGGLAPSHADPRDARSRDAALRSAGPYHRDYDMPMARDQRDTRDPRDRREIPAQAQHVYHQQHGPHNHSSPHPPASNRYAPPQSAGRPLHNVSNQSYSGDHRSLEGHQRDYDGQPPASHEAREREWAFNEEMRRMHSRRQ